MTRIVLLLVLTSAWATSLHAQTCVVAGVGECFALGGGGGGGEGGSSIILDLGDDGGNDSIAIGEIATTGDTNSIFTEPAADKLRIDLTKDWPKADVADEVTCTGCVTEDELAATLAFDDGDLLDLSSITPNTTTEGLRVPQAADCTGATAEGQICWDTNQDALVIGRGDGQKIVGKDEMIYLSASDWMSELTNGPEKLMVDGTNFDYLVLAFDQTTSECATAQFGQSGDVVATIFGVRVNWTAAAGTPGQTIDLDFSFYCKANNEALDGAATATVTVSDALLATGDTHLMTNTVTSGCTSGDVVIVKMCRAVATDTLAADARILSVAINPQF